MSAKSSGPVPGLVVCGVIPARMNSHRLPGKPLLPICGRPMIHWVFERARANALLSRLVVATDSDQILRYCGEHRIPTEATSSRHHSGTDRVIEVMQQDRASGRAADIYVNIQGDEPMVTPGHISLLLKPFVRPTDTAEAERERHGQASGQQDRACEPQAMQVSTLKVAITNQEAANPDAVKVVTDSSGRALYFSRAAIPHDRDGAGRAQYFKHLGLYAYTPAALRGFQSLPPSPLEMSERLEQLRFLENGISIAVLETDEDTIGVDTEEDLRRVERHFRQTGLG